VALAIFVLGVSIALQFAAAIYAVSLIRVTGHRIAWLMLAAAMVMMAIRRILVLADIVYLEIDFDVDAEFVALGTSMLLAAGMASIRPFFHSVRRKQDALAASEMALAEAQSIAHVGSWEWNVRTDEVWWSDEHYRIFGLKPGSVPASYSLFVSGVHPDDKERVLTGLESARAERRLYDLEFRILRPDGGEREVRTRGGMIYDKDGMPVRMRGTIQDITSSKLVEEELRRSEARFRALIENARDIILLIAADATILFASPSVERVMGFKPWELVGHKGFDRVHPDDGALLRELHGRINAIPDHVERIDLRFRHADGSWHVLDSIVCNLLHDPAVGAIVINARDITDRIAMEDQLRQAQKMQAVGQLTGGIAHDFNNLLSVVLGNLEVLSERVAHDPALLALARPAATAAERGAILTERLLAFSRRQALQPRVVRLNEFITGMAERVQRTVGDAVEVEIITAAGLWPCEVDPTQLENAILNLAINARNAMPGGGKLTIEAANARLDDDYAAAQADVLPGHYVSLSVTDDGKGMSAKVLKHAFEPFFTTAEVGKGSGLGLSMVYGFVKQSGGHVTIYSEERCGTTVRMYLPRLRAATASAAPGQLPQPDYMARGETVLVVEDDVEVRSLAVALLADLGYGVLEAGHGQAALDLLTENPRINLLLTDMVLPGEISGGVLAAKARKIQPGIRVIYMSGYTENAINRLGEMQDGAIALQKPFRRAELAHKLRQALDPDHRS